MKRLGILLFGLFFWTQYALALPSATATFFSKKGEAFQFIFDGRFVNRGGTNVVRLYDIPAGYHTAEFRIPGRRGVLVHRTQVYIEPARQSEFILQIVGYGRQALVRKVAEKPLRPYHPNQRPSSSHYQETEPYGNNDYESNVDRYGQDDRYNESDNTNRPEQCRDILGKQQVDLLLQSMATRNSETSKESIARQALSQNSVLAEDLKEILAQFQYENTRLEFAKFAYNATCDRRNFYVVNEVLTYDASIRELEEYINRR
ncbi:DUF4476 domain-containing protein [Adhaeribacter radiodurans]|uniref:DUF4476 domain-containing protein n=1 Tax=Adhaeribacter radiodurans TaxID=2745197 RepID=A0A7L7L514_9BACT|nr:DUF4476 domain-containing protein [Adhaeribacter radiodurans]QMU27685.1 DUF4476 domain-containing protein [Adhaeribacter radiodurans]